MNDREPELSLLFSSLVDGDIEAEDFARLNHLMETDAAARAHYVRLMLIHADLPDVAIRAASDPSHTMPQSRRRSLSEVLTAASRRALEIARRPTSISLTAAAVVVGLFVAMLGLIAVPIYQRAKVESEVVEKITVASITRLHQPQWPAEYAGRSPRRHLFAGDRIELVGGFAELTFVDGARVTMQGPILFRAVSGQSGYVERGRLTAIVPPEAIGFSIRTPCMDVVDLGTEFGVAVDEDGTTNAEVFSGRIEVSQITAGQAPTGRITLTQGEAARATPTVVGIATTEPKPEEFVRTKKLTKIIDEGGYQRWRDLMASLKNDADVVALYDFERQEQADGVLPNSAARGQGKFAGRIDGPQWTTGRWEEKQALQFQQAGDRVQVDFTGEQIEQLTLTAWVNIEQLKHTHNALVHSDEWDRTGATHWTLLADGRIELAVFGSQPAVVQSEPGALSNRLGRWVHLAVVYDAQVGETKFYVNGQPHGTRNYTAAIAVDLGQAQVGDWLVEPRNLLGSLDELIVFRRALSDEAIRRNYLLSKP